MEIETGQIWKDTKNPMDGAYVCATQDNTVWYKHLKEDPFNANGSPIAQARWTEFAKSSWQRASKDLFSKRYEFSKYTVKFGTYWRNKATKETFTVHGVATRGMDVVLVCFLMSQVPIEQFYIQYEPLSLMEQAQFIVDNIKPPEPILPTRLESIEKEEEPE